ncbi:hypothetical protein [Paenibacillus sp. 1A_MP2]|uniref:hypothetical protein n=1 Tax=Paenibacillus sp. 1A_MP2 TaxID=3457495 RepID=UPI003FCC4007
METKISIINGLFNEDEYIPTEKIELVDALVNQSIVFADFSKLSQQERDELFFIIQGELMKRNPDSRSSWRKPQSEDTQSPSEDYESPYYNSDHNLLLYLGALYKERIFSDYRG